MLNCSDTTNQWLANELINCSDTTNPWVGQLANELIPS